jgi:O-antigen/teichoic acid export membrane protein
MIKNYIYLLTSQVITLVLNIVMSFVFPMFLSLRSFGYWQFFLFYSSFVGLFHFGFNDGVYLRYGGRDLKSLNGSVVKAQFLILCVIQIVLSVCILAYQLLFGREDLKEIVLFVAIFMVINNLTSFITGFYQAVNKLNIFSNVAILTSLFFLIFIGFLFIIKQITLLYIIISYITSSMLGFLYTLYHSQEIFKSKLDWKRKKLFFSEFKINTIVGFFLMISSISGMLILGFGRFSIEKKWGVITFGIVSFSFTIAAFLLFFVRQIGIVIFPLLKRVSSKSQKKYFTISINILNIFFLGCLLFVPLINYTILNWLPKYSESLKYFIYVVPMIIYEGKMQIILNTYMKAQRNEKSLMYVNIISLIISIFLSCIGYYNDNVDFIIISMTLATVIRAVTLELFLNYKMSISSNISILIVLIMMSIFILSFALCEIKNAWLIYFICYILFLIVNKSNIIVIRTELNKYLLHGNIN